MLAGLRSQTPISHTASNPQAARESHSSTGTVSSVTGRLYFRLSSRSQVQALIS